MIVKYKKRKFNFLIRLISKALNIFKNFKIYITLNRKISSIKNIGIGNEFDENITINKPEYLKIGNNNFFGRDVFFIAHGKIEIGNNCTIAADCKFITRNHGFTDKKIFIKDQPYSHKPIKIGDNVWFGYNVVVLPGVTLGSGCVVGAGSIITKSFPDNSKIAGVPAKMLSKIN
jgi:acetyltransferase-like isoleucine patch superfamily enzyme